MKDNFRKYTTEFIGTFFLVFTVGCTILFGQPGVIPAIAIGGALMVMVYAGGKISGGHYNPAVSLAAVLRGSLSSHELIPYWIAQILGALAAAFLLSQMVLPPIFNDIITYETTGLIIGEFLFTFALCYVVLNTTTSDNTKGNSYYGLAIGSTVLVGLIATSGSCYGAFNPAVALGIFTMGITQTKLIAITLLTNFVAGACAAGVYKVTNND